MTPPACNGNSNTFLRHRSRTGGRTRAKPRRTREDRHAASCFVDPRTSTCSCSAGSTAAAWAVNVACTTGQDWPTLAATLETSRLAVATAVPAACRNRVVSRVPSGTSGTASANVLFGQSRDSQRHCARPVPPSHSGVTTTPYPEGRPDRVRPHSPRHPSRQRASPGVPTRSIHRTSLDHVTTTSAPEPGDKYDLYPVTSTAGTCERTPVHDDSRVTTVAGSHTRANRTAARPTPPRHPLTKTACPGRTAAVAW